MPRDKVPPDFITEAKRAFDVDLIACLTITNGAPIHGLRDDVESDLVAVHSDRREADAIDGHARAQFEMLGVWHRHDQPPRAVHRRERADGPAPFNETSEHQAVPRSRMRAMILRVPSRSPVRPATRVTSMLWWPSSSRRSRIERSACS